MAKRFVVLASPDAGTTWEKQPIVEASGPDAAIQRTRKEGGFEQPSENATQFVAFSEERFTPKKMEKEIIERWSLQPVPEEKAKAQEQLG